jgi:hypothetical protein
MRTTNNTLAIVGRRSTQPCLRSSAPMVVLANAGR